MSFIEQIAEFTKAKAKLAQVEAKLLADRVSALSKLPAEYGYASLNDFIKALKDAEGKGGKSKTSKAAKGAKAAKAPKAPKAPKAAKGKRAKLTPEVKAEVKAMVDAGKTGSEIAEALGISAPSVQNIKKELGLVKARAAAPAAAVAVEAAPAQSE
jgi:DNA-binding NarL/FixJ family response regulator